jgi:hypothetical protein
VREAERGVPWWEGSVGVKISPTRFMGGADPGHPPEHAKSCPARKFGREAAQRAQLLTRDNGLDLRRGT